MDGFSRTTLTQDPFVTHSFTEQIKTEKSVLQAFLRKAGTDENWKQKSVFFVFIHLLVSN